MTILYLQKFNSFVSLATHKLQPFKNFQIDKEKGDIQGFREFNFINTCFISLDKYDHI